jgi:hypothetical protein
VVDRAYLIEADDCASGTSAGWRKATSIKQAYLGV